MANYNQLPRRRPWKRAILAAGLLLASSSCSGKASRHEELCTSPAVESPIYKGDPSPSVKDDNQLTWRKSVTAAINPPTDPTYRGIIVGYRNPNDNDSPWEDSDIVSPNGPDEHIVLGVGRGDVEFHVRAKAVLGSPVCTQTLQVTFAEHNKSAFQLNGSRPNWSN